MLISRKNVLQLHNYYNWRNSNNLIGRELWSIIGQTRCLTSWKTRFWLHRLDEPCESQDGIWPRLSNNLHYKMHSMMSKHGKNIHWPLFLFLPHLTLYCASTTEQTMAKCNLFVKWTSFNKTVNLLKANSIIHLLKRFEYVVQAMTVINRRPGNSN